MEFEHYEHKYIVEAILQLRDEIKETNRELKGIGNVLQNFSNFNEP